MHARHIHSTIEGAVTIVTIDRPEAMNALTMQMHRELQVAFDAFAADDTQRICVVTGAGARAFCAGSDLKSLAAAMAQGDAVYPRHGYAGLIERFDLDKVLIAAVNGTALGGGFEIALTCDIVVAAEHATFGLPEPKVGAVALGGGLHRLARQIGLKPAMGMILGARAVSAAEGFRLGFLNEVVPAEELMAAVRRWCDDILRCAPMAVRASKQTALRGLDEASLADALRHQADYPAFAAWRGSDELREGTRAFAERRTPRWNLD